MSELETELRAHIDAATAAIDRLDKCDIAEAKKKLEAAIKEIVAMRDKLIAARRSGAQVDNRLRDTNAVLSTIFGTEYPLGGLQWKRVGETKDALAKMLRR